MPGMFPEYDPNRANMARAFGVASGFSTSAGAGIFCLGKFALAAPGGHGALWLIAGVLGLAASGACMYDLMRLAKDISRQAPPPPPAPPALPSPPKPKP
jgi:hypothetical protein